MKDSGSSDISPGGEQGEVAAIWKAGFYKNMQRTRLKSSFIAGKADACYKAAFLN